jgi:hypothetical protein
MFGDVQNIDEAIASVDRGIRPQDQDRCRINNRFWPARQNVGNGQVDLAARQPFDQYRLLDLGLLSPVRGILQQFWEGNTDLRESDRGSPTTHTWHAVANPRMRNCSTVAKAPTP